MQSKSTMRMTMRGTWFATMSHAADLGTFIVHFQSARTSSWFANSRQSSVTKVCSNCLAKAWNLWVELWTVTVIFLCWSQISQRERERAFRDSRFSPVIFYIEPFVPEGLVHYRPALPAILATESEPSRKWQPIRDPRRRGVSQRQPAYSWPVRYRWLDCDSGWGRLANWVIQTAPARQDPIQKGSKKGIEWMT